MTDEKVRLSKVSDESPAPRRKYLCCDDYKCRRKKPILVRQGWLSKAWYVVTDYKDMGNGSICATTRHEVTEDFNAYLLSLGWTPPQENDDAGPPTDDKKIPHADLFRESVSEQRARIRSQQEAANITPAKAASAFSELIESSRCSGCGEYVGHATNCPFRARLVDDI